MARHSGLGAFALLLLLIAGAAVLWTALGQREGPHDGAVAMPEEQSGASSSNSELADSQGGRNADVVGVVEEPLTLDERRPAVETALYGRVVEPSGKSVPAGTATWSNLVEVDWASQRSFWLEEVAETTNAEVIAGSYRFPTPLNAGGASYVYATAPRHLAAAVQVSPESKQASPLTMDPCRSIEVIVLDEEGFEVPAVEIRSLGWTRAGETSVLLAKTYLTGEDGRAIIHPLPNPSVLMARGHGLESGVWLGKHRDVREPITLRLRSTFSAAGKIAGAPTAAALAGCEIHVRSAAEDWRTLLTARPTGKSGSWEVEGIPFIGAGSYVFRLQGNGLTPIERILHVSTPGEHITCDFDWTTGLELDLFTYVGDGEFTSKEDEESVAGVLIVAIWRGESGEWVRYATRSNDDGAATLEHVPATQVWVRTYARGFVGKRWGPLEIAANSNNWILLPLDRAGSVRGRVVHGSQPVTDFKVTHWGSNPAVNTTDQFMGREDGTFEVDGLPLGRAFLMANTEDLPACAPQAVEVSADRDAEVLLELPSPCFGHGRVIDGRTGEPLAKARVQVYGTAAGTWLEPWGAPMATAADGTFDGLSLSPSANIIEFSAEGYAPFSISRGGLRGPNLDLGWIALAGLSDLAVELVSTRAIDFTAYRAVVGDRPGEAPLSFDSQGRTSFKGLRPGSHYVMVYTPDGGRLTTDTLIYPGREGLCRIRVTSDRTVRVRLRPEAGARIPEDVWLGVFYREEGGEPTDNTAPIRDGEAVLSQVACDRIALNLITAQGVVLASHWVDLPTGDLVEVDFPIPSTVLRVLFIDEEEQPIPSTYVAFSKPEDPTAWQLRTRTDSNGMVELTGLRQTSVLAEVIPSLGETSGLQIIDLTTDQDPIVVRVDTSSRLCVRLLERDQPAPGVSVSLYSIGCFLPAVTGTSDGDGCIEMTSLAPGPYRLAIESPAYWRSQHDVSASPEPAEETLQVRRTGSLRVHVTRGGLPLGGASLELHSVEFATDVADWADELALEDGDLSTDVDGRVTITGLPNGPYAWSVVLEGQVGSSGKVDVAPLSTTDLEVALPE